MALRGPVSWDMNRRVKLADRVDPAGLDQHLHFRRDLYRGTGLHYGTGLSPSSLSAVRVIDSTAALEAL